MTGILEGFGGGRLEMGLFLLQSLLYDALILSSVAWIVKKDIALRRFFMALGLSLVASFVAFLLAPIFLIFIPLAIVKIAFDEQRLKKYALQVIYFYTLSALASGVVHMFGYFIHFAGLGLISYVVVVSLLILLVAVAYMLKNHFLKKQYVLGELEHEVTFFCGEASTGGIGFVDTGNELMDEVTMSPVMVVPRTKATAICQMIEEGKVKTWPLSYYTIDNTSRFLTAFKPTLLLIDDVIVKGVIIGLCDTEFDKYDFLMQPDIVNGM